MARELLTVKQLESHKGDEVLRDGNGLMLRGSRWALRIRARGKRHDLGLGGWPEVGLKQARQKAAAARERARSSSGRSRLRHSAAPGIGGIGFAPWKALRCPS